MNADAGLRRRSIRWLRVAACLAALCAPVAAPAQAPDARGAAVRNEAADGPAQVARRVQTALYAQGELLARQMAALRQGDPHRQEMYALFVAGDGSQEVFRREVEWVSGEFARRFDTAGRSLVLANSRSAVARLPMATDAGIERALAALARRMDRDQDLLFVFQTSHGSADHELQIAMPGMELPQLPARRLGELLKASGIRRQVVVVSACYSGGFIDSLKGPTTWVITAARADRSSFGCADENDFTYFGRALFKESLPRSATLSDAFAQARAHVAEWERELLAAAVRQAGARGAGQAGGAETALAHSEPQMDVSPAFQREVDAWFAAHPPVAGSASR
jgi:hypothetical protein